MTNLNLNPEIRVLRQFGFFALFGFGFLAVIAHYEAFIFSFGLGAARANLVVVLGLMAGVSFLFSLI